MNAISAPPHHLFNDVDAVLFDLDGTLIDSAPDLGGAADDMRVRRGLPSLPLAQYRPLTGAGARGMLEVAFGITPDHPDYKDLREEFFQSYEVRMTRNTALFDGVAELIEALRARGVPWGVVTNKAMRFTDPLTRAMPFFASTGAVVSGDTTPHPKPHPAPLFEASRRLGVAPERCIFVGDDERDIVAGHAARMGTVAAAYGYLGSDPQAITRWGAHAAIDEPLHLLRHLPT